MPEKHMPYYKLLDRFDQAGCPVCRSIEESVDGYLDSLLYESVNDRTLRARFARDRGLCNHHLHRLGPRGDGLGIGILYRDIVGAALKSLQEPGGEGELPLNTGSCAVCDFEADAERRTLELFSAFGHEVEFRERFESSSGLCLPHLVRLAPLMPGGRLEPWFAEFHARRLEAFKDELEAFLEACNVTSDRVAHDSPARKSQIWRRIPDLVSGSSGIARTGGSGKPGRSFLGFPRGTGKRQGGSR